VHPTKPCGTRWIGAGAEPRSSSAWQRTTLRIVAEQHDGPVFGFDSFQGLPEHWRLGFETGMFAQQELPRGRRRRAGGRAVRQTLPGFLADHPGPVSFLHCDADLYSSTAHGARAGGAAAGAGSVVLFDEYYNYPGWPEHEYRAWSEHVARTA
jgi:hypothetical protein